jgi:hypothetical protein
VVYLADCRKYKTKEADEKDIVEHISFALYHDTFDHTRNKASFEWDAVATPSYPDSQRVDSMGGAFVEWTAGKQDDRINANFAQLQRRFWVHSLSPEGDPTTNATGIASLGDHDMRCYKSRTSLNFPHSGWYYRCSADYFCTRKQRQIRRTQFSISKEKVDVQISAEEMKKGIRNERVEGLISNVYYWIGTLNPEEGSGAKEVIIDQKMKQYAGEYHSVRIDWRAGQSSSDPGYDPKRIKLISEAISKRLNPEINSTTKGYTQAPWDSDWIIYKAPFPASIKVQMQIAFQEQLDWKATDTINIDIISYDSDSCSEAAAWAKVLSGLFAGAAAVATGGASAVLSGLGGMAGGIHTAACLSG